MTNEQYFEYMNYPLSSYEKTTLVASGWLFNGDQAIYKDDWDGCMAYGIRQVRKILLSIQHRELYSKNKGNCKLVLEELGF
jgi:hypothetical protein